MRRRAERNPPDGNVVLEINEIGVVVGLGGDDTRPTPADVARAVSQRGRLLHPNQAKSLVGYLRNTRPVNLGGIDGPQQPGLLLLTLVVRQTMDEAP